LKRVEVVDVKNVTDVKEVVIGLKQVAVMDVKSVVEVKK